MLYKGSCHCGKVAFEAEGTIDGAMACNCSICQRKGSLLWFIPRDAFTLKTPESEISTYVFNKHVIQHKFCKTCGMHPFAYGIDPKGNEMAAVNIRCVDDIDLEKVPVQHFNGRGM